MNEEVHTIMGDIVHALMGDKLKVVPNFKEASNLKDVHKIKRMMNATKEKDVTAVLQRLRR